MVSTSCERRPGISCGDLFTSLVCTLMPFCIGHPFPEYPGRCLISSCTSFIFQLSNRVKVPSWVLKLQAALNYKERLKGAIWIVDAYTFLTAVPHLLGCNQKPASGPWGSARELMVALLPAPDCVLALQSCAESSVLCTGHAVWHIDSN